MFFFSGLATIQALRPYPLELIVKNKLQFFLGGFPKVECNKFKITKEKEKKQNGERKRERERQKTKKKELTPVSLTLSRRTKLYTVGCISRLEITPIHGPYIRWYLINKCARKEQSLLICLRHLFRSRAVIMWMFFTEKSLFFFMRAQYVLSYQLI